ncbi:hypothetical protein [Nocardia sp. NPDC047038]|uniref:hypothetical protein n=1 Tax=Nocardia sp. NPDC047038 TaxID=3154338 RepID=UPI00340B466D
MSKAVIFPAGFTVAEDWAVTGTGSPEQLRTHQSAVSTALNEMLDVQTTAPTASPSVAHTTNTPAPTSGQPMFATSLRSAP